MAMNGPKSKANLPKLPPLSNEIKEARGKYKRLCYVALLEKRGNSNWREELKNWPDFQIVASLLETEESRRVELLAHHYKIDTQSADILFWSELALSLAKDFVDHFDVFSIPRKRGPKIGKGPSPQMIVTCVDDVRLEKQCNISEACSFLVKRKSTFFFGKDPTSLETRYHEGKKQLKAISWILSATDPAGETTKINGEIS